MRDSRFVCAVLTVTLSTSMAFGQGLTPEESLRRMTVPEGFVVELVAGEPLVRQPVAIDFDDRGRMWVMQYLQYPNPAGLQRVQVDRYSRTKYDRIPDPPPRGPVGVDQLTILEDTDGDGRAETAKDFVKGLNLASAFAFGHGGVFVLNVPYLLFYPDRNRDDVPDSDPEVLLTGFGMEDAHSVANSLTWGPDGWLYGCQGSTVTANIRGIEFQQGVWRYHPVTKAFDLFAEGGGNSWGLDFDRDGQLLYSTNFGGYVALHARPGASLWKLFSKHGELHHPYAFGFFDHIPHTDFRGGHITVGGVFYRGAAFPPEFRGRFITGDLLGHAVHWQTMTPNGSTFRTAYGGTLLNGNDPWFAPTDLSLGPDGAIYVTDWHDQRTAHPDPDAEWDRTNGRIYRIRPQTAAKSAHRDPNTLSSAELVALLDDPNDWNVRRARRILAERQDPAVWPALRQRLSHKPPREIIPDKNSAAEALWALWVSGGFDETAARVGLDHPDEAVRWWIVRFLGEQQCLSSELAEQVVAMAQADAAATVRAELACMARRLPLEQGWPILAALLMRDVDADDAQIPLLIWWGVETHALNGQEAIVSLVTSRTGERSRLIRDVIRPRLMWRYAAEGTATTLAASRQLLEYAVGPEARRKAIADLKQGLKRAKEPVDSQLLATTLQPVWSAETSDPVLLSLGLQAQLPGARNRWQDLLRDPQTPVDVQRELLQAAVSDDDLVVLLQLIDAAKDENVKSTALRALGRLRDDGIAASLLERYGNWSPNLRGVAREVLLTRSAWTAALLRAVDSSQIPVAEVPATELTRVALHRDAELDRLVRKHWGVITSGTPEERLAEVRRLNNDLRAANGSVEQGTLLYKKHCANCHPRPGEGPALGPDLAHANRQDRQFLLVSLVDPSSQIRGEFVQQVLETTDGRIVSGLLVEQTAAAVTLRTTKHELITVARPDIEVLQTSPVSLMPENLLKLLTPRELRDLFAYLQQPGPLKQ